MLSHKFDDPYPCGALEPHSLTPPLLPRKPAALIQCSASAPEIHFSGYSFNGNQVLIDAEEYFDSVQKNA